MRRVISGLVLSACALSAQAAIDFEGLPLGTAITDQVAGVSFSATGGINEAWVYDTANGAGRDPDLTAAFTEIDSGETLSPGLVLIIQENSDTGPDDAAGGGTLSLVFDSTTTLLSMDVFDVDLGSFVTLKDSNGAVIITRDLLNSDTSDSTTPNRFEHVVFGAAGVGVAGVKSIDVTMSKSGAIDNIATVPVPAAAWLLGSGLIALASLKRRKR